MTKPRIEFLSSRCYRLEPNAEDKYALTELLKMLDDLFNDNNIRECVAAMDLKDTVDLMLSDNYRDRLKAEYLQAKIRYDKLFNKLCEEHDEYSRQTAMFERQLDVMLEYINVLEDRLIHEARE